MRAQNPEVIGKGTERNTAAFFLTVLFSTSAVAVAGQFLPGDWVRVLPGAQPCAVLVSGADVWPGCRAFSSRTA